MIARSPTTGGRLVYAVGDVHGYTAQLETLIAELRRDAAIGAPVQRPLLVFIGDYVDRGPDSRGAVEAVMRLEAGGLFDVVALMGNHEHALLRFLDDPAFAPAWVANWGQATLRSYGVEPPRDLENMDACARTRAAFTRAFPAAHRAFFERLPLRLTLGDYLFVHAGVRPGVALAEQADRDLMWIRHEFLHSDEDLGAVVVHGHTPSEAPEHRANRIGIDTGVYMSGVLTAVRLEGADVRFIQARG